MLREGTWYFSSTSDPRWSASGRGLVGAFSLSPEAEARLEELKAQLGDPPADLTWGYMKD
jgi:hypothetical protein